MGELEPENSIGFYPMAKAENTVKAKCIIIDVKNKSIESNSSKFLMVLIMFIFALI